MKLTNQELASLPSAIGFIETDSVNVAAWLDGGMESGESLPADIKSVERVAQYLRSNAQQLPYPTGAETLAAKLTMMIKGASPAETTEAEPVKDNAPTKPVETKPSERPQVTVTKLRVESVTADQALLLFDVNTVVDVAVQIKSGDGEYKSLGNTGEYAKHKYKIHGQDNLLPDTDYTMRVTPIGGEPSEVKFKTKALQSENQSVRADSAKVSPDNLKSKSKTKKVAAGEMTFAQLKAHARARMSDCKLHFEDDFDYAAEFVLATGYPYYTVGGGVVKGHNEPDAPSNATLMPKPSGGDDTEMMQSYFKNGGRVQGQATIANPYLTDGLNVSQNDLRIWDAPTAPIKGMITFWNITGDDVRIFRSLCDAKEEKTARSGFVLRGALRTHIIKSGLHNTLCSVGTEKTDTTGAGVWCIGGADDFYISQNTFKKIRNVSSGNTHRANTFLFSGSKGPSVGGICAGNKTDDTYSSNGELYDSDFATFQGAASTSKKTIYMLGNEATDFGKRLGKHQDRSNVVWRSTIAKLTRPDTAKVDRKRLCMFSVQPWYVGGSIDAKNNHWTMGVQDNFVAAGVRQTVPSGARSVYKNIDFQCNRLTIESNPPGNHDHYVFTHEQKGKGHPKLPDDDSSNEDSSCIFANNLIDGGGSVRYYWQCGGGFNLKTGKYDRSGNKFDIRFTKGEVRNNQSKPTGMK